MFLYLFDETSKHRKALDIYYLIFKCRMEITVNDIFKTIWELDEIMLHIFNQKDLDEELEVIFSREEYFQDIIVKI